VPKTAKTTNTNPRPVQFHHSTKGICADYLPSSAKPIENTARFEAIQYNARVSDVLLGVYGIQYMYLSTVQLFTDRAKIEPQWQKSSKRLSEVKRGLVLDYHTGHSSLSSSFVVCSFVICGYQQQHHDTRPEACPSAKEVPG